MIEKILELFHKAAFNFPFNANPHDEGSYIFDEWNKKYGMKYAICKVLEPKTILEVGVKFGYSAITFLSAAPDAKFTGIYNDAYAFGCTKQLTQLAKKITKNNNIEILILNNKISNVPNDCFDLIHIDELTDGDKVFNNLEQAIPHAKWILFDGFFSSKETMLSATFFLERYKQFIEFTIIIPETSGDLLIKLKESAKKIRIPCKTCTDKTIREDYNQTYFLQDCGGFDSFKKYQGKQLTDERLLAALYLANPAPDISILDIGCGRGELCYALAQAEANVIGIDYSPSAISIAEKTYHDTIKKDKLEFICDDILHFKFNEKFDRIIATDFIEHIANNRFEQVLSKAAELLKPEGLFIIHTSPNALNYEIPYEEKRTLARSIGSYLPKNPRSYYETVMHINEQSPDLLTTNLKKYFQYVAVWVATPPDIVGSLARAFSTNETINAKSIFAVASHSPLDTSYFVHQLVQNPLDTTKLKAKISVQFYPRIVAKDEHFTVEIILENLGYERWVSLPPNPVHLSYHWFGEMGELELFDGIRTPIRYPLLPGKSRQFSLNVIAPKVNGEFLLQITLVQEACFWFENIVSTLPVSVTIKTKPDEK